MNTIEIVIENTQSKRTIEQGTSLSVLAQEYYNELQKENGTSPYPILGALVNNRVESLEYNIFRPKTIQFFDITHRQGWRIYQNSLCFLLYKATRDIYPQSQLTICHSMTNGFYCTIRNTENGQIPDQLEMAQKIRERMHELQISDLPFSRKSMLLEDAITAFENNNVPGTLRLLKGLSQLYVSVQSLDGTIHKTASQLAPTTGCLHCWDFYPYEEGYILQCPDRKNPSLLSLRQETPKLFNVFQEHKKWVKLLGADTIPSLNEIVRNNGANHLIHVAEALHEKKYAEIAEMIYQRKDKVRMVLLAGPSSSGKTTSCRRLSVQLSILGFDVKQISLDDYFVHRERTPKLPNGEYDFENIEALDIPLLNEHLHRLFNGEEVEIPTFDFLSGNPYYSGKTMKLTPQSILLVEGIHALNPRLTSQIDDELKFRVYLSALTQIAIDNQNMIHSSDNRLIRRMVRDNNFRGWPARETLRRWPEVQRGERIHIFPYQENADVMFNTALLYELGVLRTVAEPLLKRVPETCEEYAEAQRLLSFIELIEPIDPKYIPPTSIMREFLGGSSFEY